MRPLSLLILTSIHTASSTPLYNTVFDSQPVRSRIVNARANLVPSGWDYLGCYADSGTRLLPIHLTSGNAMTRPSCLASCAAAGYIAGGVEFGDECWCSASRPAGTPLAESYCNMACTGDSATTCGAAWRINVYARTPGTSYVGCFSDSGTSRTLPFYALASSSLTPSMCMSTCASAGYAYAGMEYARSCYCGNSLNLALKLADTSCNTPCAGDTSLICGNSYVLSVYAVTPGSVSASVSSTSSTISTTAMTAASTGSSGPVLSIALPSAVYLGCYPDSGSPRSLSAATFSDATRMTPALCQSKCASYQYFGVEYGSQCYCSNTLFVSPVSATQCNQACSGDKTTICGASYRLSVYQQVANSVSVTTSTASTTTSSSSSTTVSSSSATSTILTSASLTSASYIGCYADSGSPRSLPDAFFSDSKMTPALCQAKCSAYRYFGLEYGVQCWCSNTAISAEPRLASECSQGCGGNSGIACGASYKLSVYSQSIGTLSDGGSSLVSASSATSTTATTTSFGTTTQSSTVPITTPATSSAMSSTITSTSATSSSTCSPVIFPTSSSNWSILGCYVDSGSSRTLTGAFFRDQKCMTNERCQTYCAIAGYAYAGTENGIDCYCGNTLLRATTTTDNHCSSVCIGDSAEACGGSYVLTLSQARSS